VTTLSRSATKNKTYISNEVDESGADVATTAAEKQHAATAIHTAPTPAILYGFFQQHVTEMVRLD